MLCAFVYRHVREVPQQDDFTERGLGVFFLLVVPCRPFLACMPVLEVTLLQPCFAAFVHHKQVTFLKGEFISGLFFCWCIGPS